LNIEALLQCEVTKLIRTIGFLEKPSSQIYGLIKEIQNLK